MEGKTLPMLPPSLVAAQTAGRRARLTVKQAVFLADYRRKLIFLKTYSKYYIYS